MLNDFPKRSIKSKLCVYYVTGKKTLQQFFNRTDELNLAELKADCRLLK